ncbi:restriction endonuclease-like protein [Halobacillus sp. BBL2006]|uniref:restriction endonuclease-like protein n=1 Tax=Halobacillus sp. BBL2006 TaxID=1543706 RepID=UPI0005423D65|nr:restriction endonuclease-like protein [Halobacillus sp. BBL2006]KHE67593.1 hypothetical protein LD39_16755 [Halobacillus sp. BBL2006]
MSHADDTKLLVIEHEQFSVHIKGRPYNSRFKNMNMHKAKVKFEQQTMQLKVGAIEGSSIQVFHPTLEKLVDIEHGHFPPVFFENEVYQLVALSKCNRNLSFHHENPLVRKSVSREQVGDITFLMGQLQFMNEVGMTEFEIRDEKESLAQVTLELFPTKLDYKEDYKRLLDEVSEEIYNLAFHFMKKTFLGASKISSKKPSPVEFYRLLNHYFKQFMNAVHLIERQPHHELVTEYRNVRGEQLKRTDSRSRQYLRKRPYLLKETNNGIKINHKTWMPERGLNSKKTLSYNTLENRFVKFMLNRLQDKIAELIIKVQKYLKNVPDTDRTVLLELNKMKSRLLFIEKSPFWRSISKLDRSALTLVMQMKQGYRDAYMIYLVLSQGLSLQGEIFKMSVKDVATLYEYWTYLKMGQILHKKYHPIDQDIIKIKPNGLFVDLDQSKSAKRSFQHPHTGEKITLSFQERHQNPPTVRQKPDIMLTVEKKGHPFNYQYIFDAKYRIDFDQSTNNLSTPGPMEDDINTMHRYRDAWVYRNKGPYERYAFGAYVLFPWMDEENYEDHPFHKSIQEVNIGGFPFLPDTSKMVEEFLEHLIESSPEELQTQGILPKGAIEYWRSSLEEKVLVGVVRDVKRLIAHKKNRFYHIPLNRLAKGWQEAKYIALYITQNDSVQVGEPNGITYYGEITNVEIVKRHEINEVPSNSKELYVKFSVKEWRSLNGTIRPVGYGVRVYTLTTLNTLKNAKELPELFMKSREELKLWRYLRRFSNRVRTRLNNKYLDISTSVESFEVGQYTLKVDKSTNCLIIIGGDGQQTTESLEDLNNAPVQIYKKIQRTLNE